MSLKYDVIISGAGPSGSLLDFLLSSINIKTLVLDKKSFPRPKICAGGLQHRAARLLLFSIGPVVEKIIYGVYFSYRSNHIFNKTYHLPLIYMLDRVKFDQFFAEKVMQAGSDYHYQCPATDYGVSNNYITVKTSKQVFASRLLVGADGTRGMVHKKLVSNKQLFKIIGYEFELGRNKVNGHLGLNRNIAIDFGGVKRGYAWVFPKNKNLSISIGGPHYDARHIKKYFKKFLSRYVLFKNIISNVKIYGQFIPVRKADTSICDYRVLAIGDAAGLGDAFTGERLFNCFKSALFASERINRALAQGNFTFEDYRRKIADIVYEDISIYMLFFKLFSLFPFLIYNILKKNDKIFEVCCQVLRGDKSYKDLAQKLNFLNNERLFLDILERKNYG